MLRASEGTEYLTAGENSLASSGCSSPAGSTCSSVDSQELQALLEELEIVPARGKRRFEERAQGSEQEEVSSPTLRRPSSSPRLDASSRPAAPPAAGAQPPAAASAQPSAAAAAVTRQGTAAQEAEVIELLDSSSSESEDEWRITAPGTSQKRCAPVCGWQVATPAALLCGRLQTTED